ncbi:hypothetical protein STSP2_00833 [Anaerohalosphaera lusitana]|uniref:Uncharacterized protein n=1 Tax=Anaerohalosphaera lusitana TaxID=1936003 RepID=A0A1U9NIN6_9BACT|nr:hypothetical protein [Anaerohalosphaera lusitana]AQT67685.1 hypothetical protein STSP2_00833 [Anaerohalosphaera lusitana]
MGENAVRDVFGRGELPWDRVARVFALLFAATLLLAGAGGIWITGQNRTLINSNEALTETNKSLTAEVERFSGELAEREAEIERLEERVDELEGEVLRLKVQNASLRAKAGEGAE